MGRKKYMNPRTIGLAVVAIGLVGFAAYTKLARQAETNKTSSTSTTAFRPKADTDKTTPPSPVPNTTPTPAITPNPSPQTSNSGQIIVSQPTEGSTVTDGTTIKGKALAFEGKVNWFIKAKDGGQLGSGTAQVSGNASVLSDFEFPLSLTMAPTKPGSQATLELYSTSPTDGSAINIVDVDVLVQ